MGISLHIRLVFAGERLNEALLVALFTSWVFGFLAVGSVVDGVGFDTMAPCIGPGWGVMAVLNPVFYFPDGLLHSGEYGCMYLGDVGGASISRYVSSSPGMLAWRVLWWIALAFVMSRPFAAAVHYRYREPSPRPVPAMVSVAFPVVSALAFISVLESFAPHWNLERIEPGIHGVLGATVGIVVALGALAFAWRASLRLPLTRQIGRLDYLAFSWLFAMVLLFAVATTAVLSNLTYVEANSPDWRTDRLESWMATSVPLVTVHLVMAFTVSYYLSLEARTSALSRRRGGKASVSIHDNVPRTVK